MDNKKRLIYAEDARRAVEHNDPYMAYCIDNVESVDAVEVVRCKNCVYRGEYFGSGRYICMRTQCTICGGVNYVCDDDFCSYGERS